MVKKRERRKKTKRETKKIKISRENTKKKRKINKQKDTGIPPEESNKERSFVTELIKSVPGKLIKGTICPRIDATC